MKFQCARQQRGMVLIIALILLMAMTLLGVSAINLSTVNLRVVNNMQTRVETMSAAQQRIDQVLSSNFPASAASIIAVEGTTPVPVGAQSYDVAMARPCVVGSGTLALATLDPANAEDMKCIESYKLPDGTITSRSACSLVRWHLKASVSSGWFGATTEICQAAAARADNYLAVEYGKAYACAAANNC